MKKNYSDSYICYLNLLHFRTFQKAAKSQHSGFLPINETFAYLGRMGLINGRLSGYILKEMERLNLIKIEGKLVKFEKPKFQKEEDLLDEYFQSLKR